MTTLKFWKAAVERAVRTPAQVLLAALGVGGAGLVDVDWSATGWLCGGAALASILTSVVVSGVGPAGPGLTEAVRE